MECQTGSISIRERKSIMHRDYAEAYFLRSSKGNYESLLIGSQMSARREQGCRRWQVLERVIDVVKVIGKRGLSHRGMQSEAAYTLDDSSIDHGIFLEMIILLGKYDMCMKEHLTACMSLGQEGAEAL